MWSKFQKSYNFHSLKSLRTNVTTQKDCQRDFLKLFLATWFRISFIYPNVWKTYQKIVLNESNAKVVLIKQTYQEILSTDPKLELIQFLSNRELFQLLTSTSYGKTVITTGKSVLKLNLLSLKVIYLKWVNIQLLASLWPSPYIQTSLCKCATLSRVQRKSFFQLAIRASWS